jgi:hypothetical protein
MGDPSFGGSHRVLDEERCGERVHNRSFFASEDYWLGYAAMSLFDKLASVKHWMKYVSNSQDRKVYPPFSPLAGSFVWQRGQIESH